MTPEIASGYRAFKQEIKPLMKSIPRWRNGNYAFERTITENNWQHTVEGTSLVPGCIPMAVDFLHRYPEFCVGKRKMRKKIVYQELLGHDLGEWGKGDISIHNPEYQNKMQNNWERDDFKELQEKYELPGLFLRLFDRFHHWEKTKQYRPESIFARFIDCYQGTFFYLLWSLNVGMFTGPTSMVDEHILLEMDQIEKRTISPLKYLRDYYQNDPSKLEALDRLHNEISEEIGNFFGPRYQKIIRIRSRAAFEGIPIIDVAQRGYLFKKPDGKTV